MALLVGDRVQSRYRVVRGLGSGGMATVFLVEDELRQTLCALKLLRSGGEELLTAFRNEFALLMRASHPHLTRVRDFGTAHIGSERVAFYVAEWVDGVSLEQGVATHLEARLLGPLLDAVDGLRALHALGVRHGDFKPSNILIDPSGRGVLIDLGCARPFGRHASVISGTPAFVAPEVLASGLGDARADLYAVGVTMQQLIRAGKLPDNPRLRELLAALLQSDPERRPRSCEDLFEALGDTRARVQPGYQLSTAFVGRQPELALCEAFVAAIVERQARAPVLVVQGSPGVGTSRFVRECVWRAELHLDVLRASASERGSLGFALGQLAGVAKPSSSVALAVQAAAKLSQGPQPVLLVVEDADRLEPSERELFTAFTRCLDEPSVGALLVSCSGPLQLPGSLQTLPLNPLELEDLRAWTGGALSNHRLEQLYRLTRGLPAEVEVELGLGGAARDDASLDDRRSQRVQVNRLGPGFDGLSLIEQRHLALLAAVDGELQPSWIGLVVDDFGFAFQLGLVTREQDRIRLRSRRQLERLKRWLGAEGVTLAHRQIADALSGETEAAPRLAARRADWVYHAALSGQVAAAEAAFLGAEALWRADAAGWLRAARALLELAGRVETFTHLGELLLLADEPRQALGAIARALRHRAPGELGLRPRLLAAQALLRLGRGGRAERVLGPLLESECPAKLRAPAFEWLARARIQQGAFVEAEHAAQQGLALEPEPRAVLLLRECLGVAASYAGRTAEAEAQFASVLLGLGDSAPPRDICRLLGHRAIAAFRAGRVQAAVRDHSRAVEVAQRHGLDDLVAVGELNLGTAQQQLGDLGRALHSYERGLVVARALGRTSTELVLLYNLANLWLEIGDLPRARHQADSLERRAKAVGTGQFVGGLGVLRAELALLTGEPAAAEHSLREAERDFARRGLQRESVEVELTRAELLLQRDQLPEAAAKATGALQSAQALNADDLQARAQLVLGRLSAERGEEGALPQLEQALELSVRTGQRLLEARVLSELAHASGQLGSPQALQWCQRARRRCDRLAANLSDDLRAIFWRDPRRARLDEFTRARIATARLVGTLTDDASAVRRLLALSRRVNSSLSLERVLDDAVDAAVELTGAERGFLVLVSEGEAPRVVATRDADAGGEQPSQSILTRALDSGEPILTTDAQADDRFAAQRSVHALRLKSVLCVPIATPSEVMGAVYVDSRAAHVRFSRAQSELLAALADHVAVALVNARLHAALEQRTRELEQQKQVVERLSRGKDREIERLHEQVEVHKRAAGLRFDYGQIVGRGPKMREVLEQVDRVVDSDVTVLIQGESGTGKELIARAIHVNGARKDAPFVGINCAALPETLLESELFGHVRGAFTGADRNKRGLLFAAHGGTLFLDEIAEMPLATQAKLLRVLQEREATPLGATKPEPFDLRLLAATHRDLAQEASAGTFREDLFYRVAVLVVRLPPLRERREDLAELARAVLQRLARDAKQPVPELSRDALARLLGYAFPGNVRELENILTRAFVLRTGGRIRPLDLELQAPGRARTSATRGQFDSEERARILEALSAARWNVSEVSRGLGIPRNTLYRKLDKYGLAKP